MGGSLLKATDFINESLLPFGYRLLWSIMLLEYPRRYAILLREDPKGAHPSVRCPCGSDQVFNYGLPRLNGRYFLCRSCERAFTIPVYRREWEDLYRTCGQKNPDYDFWLERYVPLLMASGDTPIMDLGSGWGNDTLYLRRKGFATLSCDYSAIALRRLREMAKDAPVLCFDMLDGLPIVDNSFKIIVANLSLHYFAWHETQRIVEEIRRVLAPEGHLFCRVNSTGDREHGAGQGRLLEQNFYDVGGKRKRFFDDQDLRRLFRRWEIIHCQERSMVRFGKTKFLWEIAVRS